MDSYYAQKGWHIPFKKQHRNDNQNCSTVSAFYKFLGVEIKGQTGGCWQQLHRIFTSAHADGCAEQCFEGVQFGSIIRGGKGHGRQIASLLSGWIVIARSAKRGLGGSAAWLTLTRMYLSALFCVHKPLSFSRCD